MSESKLQQSCVKYLILKYKTLGMVIASFPNEAKRSFAEAQRLKMMGLQPGIPDLAIFWDSRTLFIEFKWDKNKSTEKQRIMQELLKAQGFQVEIVYDFDTFQNIVDEFFNFKTESVNKCNECSKELENGTVFCCADCRRHYYG